MNAICKEGLWKKCVNYQLSISDVKMMLLTEKIGKAYKARNFFV